MMANLGSAPNPARGWQGSHLPIDPRLLACVATIESNSAYLSYHTAGTHSREREYVPLHVTLLPYLWNR